MILSAHQPAYLPWLGYFHKILSSDFFVYLDSVQFEKNSFINRNLIKTQAGPLWLTVPVLSKGHLDATLLDTKIDHQTDWKKKHLASIEHAYKKAPQFKILFPKIQELYAKSSQEFLSEFCWQQLCFWLAELGITTKILKSSELLVSERKSNLVLEICKKVGADVYLSGTQGRDYLDEEAFGAAQIKVYYQDFEHPTYPQLFGDFAPRMSIIDFLMNTESLDVFYQTRQTFLEKEAKAQKV